MKEMRQKQKLRHLFLVLGVLALGSTALAQEKEVQSNIYINGVEVPLQTFVISEGKAYLNGVELDQSALAADLMLDGVELHHTYFGESMPFIVGGRWFTIEGERVVPYNEEFDSEQEYALFLEKQAQYFEPIQRTLRPMEGNRLLFEIRDESPVLFERKLKESWLENQTRMMGVKIQISPEGSTRRELVSELREMLETLFELKIENQEEEIVQLSQQLVELRTRVADRKKAKDQIIEQRLHELIGQENK